MRRRADRSGPPRRRPRPSPRHREQHTAAAHARSCRCTQTTTRRPLANPLHPASLRLGRSAAHKSPRPAEPHPPAD
eukprot:scaffold17709_cov81-Phaeocystis_antarctica.AAC.2